MVSAALAQREPQQIDSLMRLAHQRGVFNGNVLVALVLAEAGNSNVY